ncbi:MAG: Fic family protein [Methylococcaceae bacterium]
MKFLHGLDNDLKVALLSQLRDLWTYTSTALEGNTLTLGETAFVLAEGLTISGKPLKDHSEVVGHARAIELLYRLLDRNDLVSQDDLFLLHRAVQTAIVVDIYQPIGAWKRESNGTNALTLEGKQTFIDYAAPVDVPVLMMEWLVMLNDALNAPLNKEAALTTYISLHQAFVRIHPFADGNGRMARLVANLPVLKSGYPPILIDRARRRDYLQCLSAYDLQVGPAQAGKALLPESALRDTFQKFCQDCWQASLDLVAEMKERQQVRSVERR